MADIEQGSDLLTVGEAADFLRLRPATIRAWLLKRRLTYVKIGRRVFVRKTDLSAAIQEGIVPAQKLRGDTRF